jgi:hypothetical protein
LRSDTDSGGIMFTNSRSTAVSVGGIMSTNSPMMPPTLYPIYEDPQHTNRERETTHGRYIF